MKTLAKEVYFAIQEDQWSTQLLIIKADGYVWLEIEDRKDGGGYNNHVATWQDFMEKHLESTELAYQQASQYIKDNLCD